MTRTWSIETTPNPAVVRMHTTVELTAATIETCPPAVAPPPLDGVAALDAVRSVDLHRYRARLNLHPGAEAPGVMDEVVQRVRRAWGDPVPAPGPRPPRAFAVPTAAPRAVAESPEMAVGNPLLAAAFRVDGVAEAIAGRGMVLVTLGPLFAWGDREDAVASALAGALGDDPDRPPTGRAVP